MNDLEDEDDDPPDYRDRPCYILQIDECDTHRFRDFWKIGPFPSWGAAYDWAVAHATNIHWQIIDAVGDPSMVRIVPPDEAHVPPPPRKPIETA